MQVSTPTQCMTFQENVLTSCYRNPQIKCCIPFVSLFQLKSWGNGLFFPVFSSLIVLALMVIYVLEYIVVEYTRKGKKVEWELHFTQIQL